MRSWAGVLTGRVVSGVLIAGMTVPAVAAAQGPRFYENQGYAQSRYHEAYGDRSGYANGGYSNRSDIYGRGYGSGYSDGDYRNDVYRRHEIGPGKGALIGGAAGLLLGGILRGGKGALIGGAAGAGVGAAAGAVNQKRQREDSWNRGYNGYAYSSSGYGAPYGR